MKPRWNAVSEMYQVALLRYFSSTGLAPDWKGVHRIGQRAVDCGMETLDLARIHKLAMVKVMQRGWAPGTRTARGARRFFMEAIIPIEAGHRASLVAAADLKEHTRILAERNAELTVANSNLRDGITQRDAAVAALRRSEKHYADLLRASRQLAGRLQLLTHRLLKTQEQGRRSVSNKLQDGIGQTLIGINVRLLALRKGAVLRNTLLSEEISSTQAVLEKSAIDLRRFAHAINSQKT